MVGRRSLVMTTQKHPLDIDFLAMVSGDLALDRRLSLESHAQFCVLCRIRIGRLARAAGLQWPPMAAEGLPTGIVPLPTDFLSSLETDAENPPLTKNQLWMAGADEYLMVWIRKSDGGSLVCHPVTLDVDLADDQTLVISDEASPIGIPLALWSGIIGDVQPSSLNRCLGDLDVRASIDALQSSSSGLQVGTAISGATDERIEYRQLLADRLAELSSAKDEVGNAQSDPDDLTGATSLRRSLATELQGRRGSGCRIIHFQEPEFYEVLSRLGLSLVGLVTEVTCRILVITGLQDPGSLKGGSDSYQEMVRLADATALALVAIDPPHLACIYDPEYLAPVAIEKGTGNWITPSPRLGPMGVADVLFKYLEQEVKPLDSESSKEPIHPAVDLDELIRAQAFAMIELKKTKRTSIKPKMEAQQALSGREADIIFRLLGAASRGLSIVDELESLPDAP